LTVISGAGDMEMKLPLKRYIWAAFAEPVTFT
jgi:hypothetical protein